MKNWRFLYYCLAAGWLVAGLGSGVRVFYVLFFAQMFLALLALAMNIWAAFSFTYVQTLDVERTLHGRPVHLSLKVHNEKIIPYPMMHIRLQTPAYEEKRSLRFNLPSNSDVSYDLTLECPYRGEYEVGMTIIDFIDIFGIVRLPFDMRLLPYYRMNNLLVYPLLDELDSLPLPTLDSKAFSRHRFATEDQHEPFSTVRKYHRGDPLKRIHWKASLKQQTLMTRQFEEAAEPHMLLVLDLNRPPWPGEAAVQAEDALCESATALIHYLLRQDWIVNIHSLGKEEREQVGKNPADFQLFYHWLAQVKFEGRSDFLTSLERILDQNKQIKAAMVITTRIDQRILNILRRQHHPSRPVFTLFAGPARPDASEALLRQQLQQSNLPAWFMHYGERLSDQLAVKQR